MRTTDLQIAEEVSEPASEKLLSETATDSFPADVRRHVSGFRGVSRCEPGQRRPPMTQDLSVRFFRKEKVSVADFHRKNSADGATSDPSPDSGTVT
jgi:hypothetical protein